MTQRMLVECLKRQYLWIDGHFNELFGMARDDGGRDMLRAAYLGSRKNLWAARHGSFIDEDPTAALLYEALVRNQEEVEMLAATGKSEGLVDLIAIGVGLGSQLAGCGATSDR